MKNIKISLKLVFGFGLLVVLAIIIGLTAWNGLRGVADRVDKSDDVNRIVKMMIETRQSEKNYEIRKDEKYITEVKKSVSDIINQANATKLKFNNDYNKKQMDDIIEKTKFYEDAFDKYVASEQAKNKLMDDMQADAQKTLKEAELIVLDQNLQLSAMLSSGNASVEKIKDKVTKAGKAHEIIKLFLIIRKNEKEVIISGENEYINAHEEYYRQTLALVEDLTNSFKLQKNITLGNAAILSLKNYKAEFDKYLGNIAEQKHDEDLMLTNARNAVQTGADARADQKEKMLAQQSSTISLLILITIIAMILGVIISWVIITGIIGPLNKGLVFAQEIANGNLMANIDVDQKDEIGKLSDALNMMVERLKDIMGNVQAGAEQIASASEESSSSSQEMSEGANEQAASLEEVSATMEEMTANMQQSSSNSQQTEKIALKAAQDIKVGSTAVSETVESMKIIADKISIISDIANQTNMLALNAAVEAARAGKKGKGFAVVATEVKNLAERSAKAAEEIDKVSADSVLVAENAGKMLIDIVPNIEKTSVLVAEITSAIAEQTASSEQISNSIDQMNKVTQQNSAVSEELSSSAEELAAQADLLKETIEFFTIDDKSKITNYKISKKKNIKYSKAKTNIKQTKGVDLNLGTTTEFDSDFEQY